MSFSTLLGGLNDERGYGITLDATNAPIITGWTATPDTATPPFPRVNALSGTYNGSVFGGVKDVFVSRLRADGATLLLSTYVGGAGSDVGQGVALDSQQMAYVTGSAGAPGSGGTPFPTTATSPVRGSGNDAFLAKFDVGVLSGATLSLSRDIPASGINSLNTPQSLVARLTVNGVALIGFPVTFSVNGANAPGSTHCPNQPNSTTTDSNGNIGFCYVGANVGTDTIQASATNSFGTTVTSPSVSVSWTKLNGAHLTLSPPTRGPYPINTTTELITATVTDGSATPNAIQGITVHFGVSGVNSRSSSPDPTTGGNGQATYSYQGGNGIGSDTVVATATDGVTTITASNSTSVTWTGGSLTLGPSTTGPVATNTSVTVTAVYVDANLAPVRNAAILFSITGPNAGWCSAHSCGATTDTNGTYNFSYQGTVAGTDTLQVSAGNGQVVSNTVTVTWISFTNGTLTLTPPNAGPNVTGSSQTMTATLMTTGATPQPISGATITFTFSGPNAPDCTTTPCTATTGGTGVATFAVTGTQVGADTVVATTTNGTLQLVSNPATIAWTSLNNPALSLSTATPNLPVNSTASVTATLTQSGGASVVGLPVRFRVTGANPQEGSVVTTTGGSATFTYTGIYGGNDTVVATLGDGQKEVQSNTVTIGWSVPLSSASLIIDPTLAGPNALNTAQQVRATVKDSGGKPLVGVAVHFAVSGANSGSSASDPKTDGAGVAFYTYSGAQIGTDTVTATVANTSLVATATVRWSQLVGARLSLSPIVAGPLLPNATTPPSQTVTAKLVDRQGNPIANKTLRLQFRCDSANLASGVTFSTTCPQPSPVADTDANYSNNGTSASVEGQTGADGTKAFTITGVNAGTDTMRVVALDDSQPSSTNFAMTSNTATISNEQNTVSKLHCCRCI